MIQVKLTSSIKTDVGKLGKGKVEESGVIKRKGYGGHLKNAAKIRAHSADPRPVFELQILQSN